MKILRAVLILLIMTFLLAPAARAANVGDKLSEALGLNELEEALPDAAEDVLRGVSAEDTMDADSLWDRLGGYIRENAGSAFGGAVRNAALLLLIAILCSTAASLCERNDYVLVAGALAIAAVSITDVSSFIRMGRETLTELSVFSKVLLPTLASAAAAGGAYTSAAAKYAASAMFFDVLITAAERLVIPLIYAYTAASFGSAALGGAGLSGASSFLKWLTVTVLTGITIAFTAYLSVTGLITGSTDAAAARAAKMAVSAALPVVGGIISDAAGAVLAGAAILRGAVGIFGLAAVLAVCLLPFLRLGAAFLLYKAAAALSAGVSDSRLSKLIGAAGTAFGLTLGTVGAAAVMLFISVISSIKAVT